jgi:hypothetical protein
VVVCIELRKRIVRERGSSKYIELFPILFPSSPAAKLAHVRQA